MSQSINEQCDDDCRCACGKLMARLTVQGFEVQCRRCKLLHIIPFPTEETNAAAVTKDGYPSARIFR